MPDSDWLKRNKDNLTKWAVRALITLVILSVGGAAIVRGLTEQSEYEWSSNQRNSEYTAEAYSPAYEACLMLASERQPDCITKTNNEYRENERKEQDLIAQQTTAVWTFLMGCAAIIGMMLSALGVYLVWTTFEETRKSNEISQSGLTHQRNIDQMEYRPIMVFEGTDVVPWGDYGDVLIPTHWRNVGRTAALVTYVSVKRALSNSLHVAHHIDELKTDREILHFNEEEIVAPNHQIKNDGLLLRKDNFRRGALSSPIQSIIGPKLGKVDQFALFICAVKYRMALGDDPREFESEVIFTMEPEWEGEVMNGRFIYKVAMGHTKLS